MIRKQGEATLWRGFVVSATLLTCGWPAVARADRDIVYAARYYTAPGKGISHQHLYRINPDGTGRTQLTTGAWEEGSPQWSPDGRQIVFVREKPQGNDSVQLTICLVSANGGPVRELQELKPGAYVQTLLWSPDSKTLAASIVRGGTSDTAGDYLCFFSIPTGRKRVLKNKSAEAWSPDGRRLYLGDVLLNVATEQTTALVLPAGDGYSHIVWSADNTLIGLNPSPENGHICLCSLDTTGREIKRVPLTAESQRKEDDPTSGRLDGLMAIPKTTQTVLLEVDNSNSTVRPLYKFCRVNRSSGKAAFLAEGQFLRFSPDGTRFCTAPGRDLGPYGTSKSGKPRMVWVAPLQVGNTASGKVCVITTETVFVTGADWRSAPTQK